MVELNSKYQNGKIYKIINDVDNLIYVGSTIKSLNIRFSEHKYDAKRSPERKLYKHFAKLGIRHFEIKLIKNYPCNNRTELDIEEERTKIRLNAQLNTYRAHQTAEQKKEQKKEWSNERLFCAICGKSYTRSHKSEHFKSKRHQKCIQLNKSKKSTDEKYEKLIKIKQA